MEKVEILKFTSIDFREVMKKNLIEIQKNEEETEEEVINLSKSEIANTFINLYQACLSNDATNMIDLMLLLAKHYSNSNCTDIDFIYNNFRVKLKQIMIFLTNTSQAQESKSLFLFDLMTNLTYHSVKYCQLFQGGNPNVSDNIVTIWRMKDDLTASSSIIPMLYNLFSYYEVFAKPFVYQYSQRLGDVNYWNDHHQKFFHYSFLLISIFRKTRIDSFEDPKRILFYLSEAILKESPVTTNIVWCFYYIFTKNNIKKFDFNIPKRFIICLDYLIHQFHDVSITNICLTILSVLSQSETKKISDLLEKFDFDIIKDMIESNHPDVTPYALIFLTNYIGRSRIVSLDIINSLNIPDLMVNVLHNSTFQAKTEIAFLFAKICYLNSSKIIQRVFIDDIVENYLEILCITQDENDFRFLIEIFESQKMNTDFVNNILLEHDIVDRLESILEDLEKLSPRIEISVKHLLSRFVSEEEDVF